MSRFGRWWDWLRQSLKRDRKTPGSAVVIDDAVERPLLAPVSGQYNDSVEVTITCATSGAAIYYETDGTTPTAASTLYSAPFTLNTVGTHDVKAIGIKAGLLDSAIGGATYEVVDSTPSVPAFDSHPPHLETPESVGLVGRADDPPGPIFYMATDGSDANSGQTEGSPVRTLSRASELMGPGDTLLIRGGHHFLVGSEAQFSASGTASLPIYLRSYPGELAYLHTGWQEFWTDPDTAWEFVDDGVPDHYRSVNTFARGLDKAANRIVGGHFGDSWIGLWRHSNTTDFAATNQYIIPGVDDAANRTNGIYTGPGAYWEPSDERFHIRLSHTEIPVLETVDYLGFGPGFNHNYTGETDPRLLSLEIPQGNEISVKIFGSHVIVQDVVVSGGVNTNIAGNGTTGVKWYDSFIYNNGYQSIITKGSDIHCDTVRFVGGDGPWVSRFAAKNLTSRVGLLNLEQTPTVRLTHCTLADAHDGAPLVWANTDVEVDFCLIYNINDDGMYLPRRAPVTRNYRIYGNIFRTVLSHLPVRENGDVAVTPDDEGFWIFRNLFDKRLPVYTGPPRDSAPTDPQFCFAYGALLQEHGATIHPNKRVYHNVLALREKQNQYMGFAEYFNDSICQIYNNIEHSEAVGSKQVNATDLADCILYESKNNLLPADTGSVFTGDINADPLFADVELDGIAHSDFSLLPASQAIGAAAAIPASWPDVPGLSQADIGAIPFGTTGTFFGPDSEV